MVQFLPIINHYLVMYGIIFLEKKIFLNTSEYRLVEFNDWIAECQTKEFELIDDFSFKMSFS